MQNRFGAPDNQKRTDHEADKSAAEHEREEPRRFLDDFFDSSLSLFDLLFADLVRRMSRMR
ncbi:MAG: hypothetical protein MZW92_25670 [Comamonadaceae bacterium]|nr:hypothetical protein [Comamonadaceae bacterium]